MLADLSEKYTGERTGKSHLAAQNSCVPCTE